MLDGWLDGIHADLRPAATALDIDLHSHAHALNSSLAFALNLFLPFVVGGGGPLAELLATIAPVERVVGLEFEYRGPASVLCELAGDEPAKNEHWTASDVAVHVLDGEGRRGIILIEVKLTEGKFTACSGAESKGNRHREVCRQAVHFFEDPDGCYLRRTYRASRDRRYWQIFRARYGTVRAAYPGVSLDAACPFRGDWQQPMRNHALAVGLVDAGHVEFAAFGLVHHDHNPDVPGPFDGYRQAAADDSLFRRPASAVIDAADACLGGGFGPWMRRRYVLD